ncbi:uncharacterized protein LOC128227881 [Mya arenaria]|uniref:uncharacterized protein LOC128227881 n=1 Tax=Mya arenaria TaxID=6604 RepID=UPI0022E41F7A|nr:uncharacterized protein LOC128227881 [Mya arenaria]
MAFDACICKVIGHMQPTLEKFILTSATAGLRAICGVNWKWTLSCDVHLQLFQSGFIFTAFVAGADCVDHLVLIRRKYYRNTTTLFAVVLSGFLHLIISVYMLTIAKNYIKKRVKQGPQSVGSCMDYSMTAAFANGMVLVFIVHNVYVQNFKWSMSSCLAYAGTLGCIITRSFSIIKIVPQNSPLPVEQNSLVTLGTLTPSLFNCNSGYFWDILPSLLQTVIFTFICSEYIGKVLIRSQYWNNEVKSNGYCDCKHKRKPLMQV